MSKKWLLGLLVGAALPALSQAAVIDFTYASFSDFSVIDSTYQPLTAIGVNVTYSGIGTYSNGPDHTSGVTGSPNFQAYQKNVPSGIDNVNTPQTYVFSQPVSIPSLWLATFGGATTDIALKAFSDDAGSAQLGSTFLFTPLTPAFTWKEFTEFAGFGTQIRRIEISNTGPATVFQGNVQVDDITVNVPEPASLGLLSLSVAGLLLRRR